MSNVNYLKRAVGGSVKHRSVRLDPANRVHSLPGISSEGVGTCTYSYRGLSRPNAFLFKVKKRLRLVQSVLHNKQKGQVHVPVFFAKSQEILELAAQIKTTSSVLVDTHAFSN